MTHFNQNFPPKHESRRRRRQEAEVPANKDNILLQVRLQARQEDKPLASLQLLRVNFRDHRDDFSERLFYLNKTRHLRPNGNSVLGGAGVSELHPPNLHQNAILPNNARRPRDPHRNHVSLHLVYRANTDEYYICLHNHPRLLHRDRRRIAKHTDMFHVEFDLFDIDLHICIFYGH